MVLKIFVFLYVLWIKVASALEGLKVTETLAHGYAYERTGGELSNSYQHDQV